MIRIIVAISLLLISTPLIGNNQTVDINTLSDYEKKLHRIGWCEGLDEYIELENMRKSVDLDVRDLVLEFVMVWEVIYYTDWYQKDYRDMFDGIIFKSKNDIRALLAIDEETEFMGKEVLDKNVIIKKSYEDCIKDFKLIIKDSYVPNYSNMKN